MKKYIELSVDVEAHYSGATYYEGRIITEDIWNNIKDSLAEEIYVGELDGKHSCVEGDLEISEWTEDDFRESYNISNDGTYLYYAIKNAMDSAGYNDCHDILKEIEEEIKALEVYENVTVKIRKEHKYKLVEFVNSLQ